MKSVLDRVYEVGEGLASMTQKRVKSLVKELEDEGVLKKSEINQVVS